ncbi:hypothetical protein FGB62_247g04 [Gracilaria domingensis]|nr:hypothetical protein FGB62_247g04 [Gracilaria domingensis]
MIYITRAFGDLVLRAIGVVPLLQNSLYVIKDGDFDLVGTGGMWDAHGSVTPQAALDVVSICRHDAAVICSAGAANVFEESSGHQLASARKKVGKICGSGNEEAGCNASIWLFPGDCLLVSVLERGTEAEEGPLGAVCGAFEWQISLQDRAIARGLMNDDRKCGGSDAQDGELVEHRRDYAAQKPAADDRERKVWRKHAAVHGSAQVYRATGSGTGAW